MKRTRVHLAAGLIPLLGLLGSGDGAVAGGFYVAPRNPTSTGLISTWSNPAGMTGLKEDVWAVGNVIIVPDLKFDSSVAEAGGNDGGNAGILSAIPSFFLVKTLGERHRFGFSVLAPLGGGVNYGRDFVGRYSIRKGTLSGLSFSPAYGYKINDKVSIGVGASIIQTVFDEDIAIKQEGSPDGKLTIDEIDDWGVQGFVGLSWQITDKILFGATYRSEMSTDLDGDLEFHDMVVEPLSDHITASWDNPQSIEVGIQYSVSDTVQLVFNLDWEDWSIFGDNRMSFEGGPMPRVVTFDRKWKDTWHAAIGLRHFGKKRIHLMGVGWDSSAVSDSHRTLDLPVDEIFRFSGQVVWPRENKLDYALGGTLFYIGDAKIDQTSQGVRVVGEFDTNLILFLGLTIAGAF